MLTQEQAQNIKEQLLSQVNQLDIPNKEELKTSIQAMDSAQLETFLKQNNLMQEDGSMPQQGQSQKCVFCSIAKGEVPSIQFYEDENVKVVLELNPASHGHTIIIPKEHIESSDKIPQEILELAKKIGEQIKSKLNPKDILIQNSNVMGHEVINVLPIYNNENLDSPRQKAEEKDLLELQGILEIEDKAEPVTVETPEIEEIDEKKAKDLWLPKRIP